MAATVGVFVAVLVFQFSITMSLIIVTVLLMVDLEVYGFIYVIGAKLNCKFTLNSLYLHHTKSSPQHESIILGSD